MGCGFQRCIAAICAPMTSINGSIADPRPFPVAKEALDHTRAYFSRPFLLHLNSVAGELVGLVPALRCTPLHRPAATLWGSALCGSRDAELLVLDLCPCGSRVNVLPLAGGSCLQRPCALSLQCDCCEHLRALRAVCSLSLHV